MTPLNEKTVLALRNLIILNDDRYEGYKTSAEDTRETELRNLFISFSEQSLKFSSELGRLLPGRPESGHGSTTVAGKLFRVWVDIKSSISARDKKGILTACLTGEETMLGAYDETLAQKNFIPGPVLELVRGQREKLREGMERVRSLQPALK